MFDEIETYIYADLYLNISEMLEVDGNLSFVYNIIPLYTLCDISYFIQKQRQYFVFDDA